MPQEVPLAVGPTLVERDWGPFGGLDSFGDADELESGDQAGGQRCRGRPGGIEVVNERGVELDPGDGQVPQDGDGGAAGAEVVELDAIGSLSKDGEVSVGVIGQGPDGRLGDLHHDAGRVHVVEGTRLGEVPKPVGRGELHGRHVDAHRTCQERTRCEEGTDLLEDFLSEDDDQPRRFRDGGKVRRLQESKAMSLREATFASMTCPC
jgi:hypothetical protein